MSHSPASTSSKPVFVVAEGINGSGKTTVLQEVAKRLAQHLGEDRIVTLFNPTQGPIGMELRRFVTAQRERGFPRFFSENRATVGFATRLAALFAADRHMMQDTLNEALSAGKVVLCDRYSLSTLVYQCAMIGDVHFQSQLAKMIVQLHEGITVPDATLVFDVPSDVARARLAVRGEKNDDRMMAQIEPAARSMYLDTSSELILSMGVKRVIDANRPLEDVVEETYNVLVYLISEPKTKYHLLDFVNQGFVARES